MRRSLTTILQRIFEMSKRKVVDLSVSFSNSSFPTIVMTKLKIPSHVNIIMIIFNDFFYEFSKPRCQTFFINCQMFFNFFWRIHFEFIIIVNLFQDDANFIFSYVQSCTGTVAHTVISGTWFIKLLCTFLTFLDLLLMANQELVLSSWVVSMANPYTYSLGLSRT